MPAASGRLRQSSLNSYSYTMSFSGTAPKTVAVAVCCSSDGQGGNGSLRAFHWAVLNLLPTAIRFILVHVMPKITSIPTPSGTSVPITQLDKNVVAIFINDTKLKFQRAFTPFLKLYQSSKMETLLLEGDNPAAALLRCISEVGIDILVLGSSPPNFITRTAKRDDVPSTVLKYAPDTCNVYVVSQKKIITKDLPEYNDVASTFGDVGGSPRSMLDRMSSSSTISVESRFNSSSRTSSRLELTPSTSNISVDYNWEAQDPESEDSGR